MRLSYSSQFSLNGAVKDAHSLAALLFHRIRRTFPHPFKFRTCVIPDSSVRHERPIMVLLKLHLSAPPQWATALCKSEFQLDGGTMKEQRKHVYLPLEELDKRVSLATDSASLNAAIEDCVAQLTRDRQTRGDLASPHPPHLS